MRRRSRADAHAEHETKKPMLEILAITDDAGLSSPNQPARPRRAGLAIRSGSARVVRMATAYSGTTTPKPRKLPVMILAPSSHRDSLGLPLIGQQRLKAADKVGRLMQTKVTKCGRSEAGAVPLVAYHHIANVGVGGEG